MKNQDRKPEKILINEKFHELYKKMRKKTKHLFFCILFYRKSITSKTKLGK